MSTPIIGGALGVKRPTANPPVPCALDPKLWAALALNRKIHVLATA
jgi:hypothetical protein